MKLFCKGNHWKIINKQLILTGSSEENLKETAMRLEAVLEAKIRLQIYNAICDMPLLENRKAITKVGIDNVALAVQALCADIALGQRSSNDTR